MAKISAALLCLICAGSPALAADDDASELKIDIEVVAKRLDDARLAIQPGLGASAFSFSPNALAVMP